jgi:hypothetical protein
MATALRRRTFANKNTSKPKPDLSEAAALWLRDARGILEQLARDGRRLREATLQKSHPLFGKFDSNELNDALNSIEEASYSLSNADLSPPCPIDLPDPVPTSTFPTRSSRTDPEPQRKGMSR